jgi:hypothetical protein
MSEERPAEAEQEGQNGYEEELAEYESELARYLESRIKPGLSRTAIPLMARSIAKEIVKKEPPEPPEGEGEAPAGEAGGDDAPDFEADMRDLQAELGEDWILRFSVHGDDGWLTAEKQDATQRVEAPDAEGLVKIVAAINEGGGRQS